MTATLLLLVLLQAKVTATSPAAPSVRGAELDLTRWKARRQVLVPRDGVFHLQVDPGELALCRPDRGDLRLADGSGHQVPYVLAPEEPERTLALTLELDPRLADRPTRWRSRYRLVLPPLALGKVQALPLEAVELQVEDEFFSRPAQVTAWPPLGAPRPNERALWSGTLQRSGTATALRLPLPRSAHPELFLAIDEGDDAPLQVTAATAIVAVPELVFEAPAGVLHLLSGNAEAAPPRYDLATRRRELLEAPVELVEGGVLERNPAYRQRLADVFRDAPPAALLWAVLLLAVAALIVLTLRALREEPSPEPGSGPPPV